MLLAPTDIYWLSEGGYWGLAKQGLNGPLPSALRRASALGIVTLANQWLEGGIPSFASTLSRFALHKNRFSVLPDLHLKDNSATTAILLHNNLLSCHVPWCGNSSTGTSSVAIGNRLLYPKDAFPAWVSKYEHDRLLWVSSNEGMLLLLKISGALSAPKSQRFLRFAIAMPIADPEIASDFRDKTKQCCIAI